MKSRYIISYRHTIDINQVYDVGQLVEQEFKEYVAPILSDMSVSYTASKYVPRAYHVDLTDEEAVILGLTLCADLSLTRMSWPNVS